MADYAEFPILCLEITSATCSLLRALDDRHDEIKKMITESLDKAIPQIKAQLDKQVYEAANEAIRTMVGEAAKEAIAAISEETAEQLRNAITQAIRRRFRG